MNRCSVLLAFTRRVKAFSFSFKKEEAAASSMPAPSSPAQTRLIAAAIAFSALPLATFLGYKP